ncbi:hypothetical protein TWF569_002720 [Orbilia oligospora]|uniref:Uncharacterized protein n=1 Tax=Orbilia oligospora TaxID=2813651 RepID=A0A7C8PVZ7_ORBOL|nr:hypothetical protein TWF569_002720 [Orbilia oligospora]KAF3176069.1 hypothetical protein TWF225_008769 [Orbilia oligospora]KAF3181425.1 hypothetical protein TWF751_009365 [Orbilia oligospora]KAF3236200.1 hypothetical protein TWF217_002790 [Orbilia oligospora]KAF3259292.1 hypothetical protein TWF128_004364 [Orbilia oligospora]
MSPSRDTQSIENNRMLSSKNAVLAFGGIVALATAFTVFGSGDQPIFPKPDDPTGDPSTWSIDQLRRWLELRNLYPSPTATREELLERVRLNIRRP